MTTCLDREKEIVRRVYVDIYPKLPMHSYRYIIEKYHPNPYLNGFFTFFTEFWLIHETFVPDNFDLQTLYNLIDSKWKDYYEFMGIEDLNYRFQFINSDNGEDIRYDEAINRFWSKYRAQ